jgi:hypothetical protein
MIEVMAVLGDPEVERRAAPRNLPRGGTPRLTTQTFVALWRRGFVRAIRHRPADGVWSEMWYWQISLDGASALNPGLSLVRGDLAVSR